jgi:hypothetical protein
MKKIIGLILCCCVLTTACVENKAGGGSSDSGSVTDKKIPPAMTAVTTTAKPLDMTTWQNNYRVFLTDLLEKDPDVKKFNFNMADIDKNGTPELLYTKGDAQTNGVKVLTFMSGAIKEVGEYGEYGKVSVNLNNGYIYSENVNGGAFTVYEYKNGVATKLVSFADNSGFTSDADEIVYQLNGENVTKEEYDAEFTNYFNDTSNAELIELKGTLPVDPLQIVMAFGE